MAKRETGRKLSHLDARGAARMVNVSGKAETLREAVAEGRMYMESDTLNLILDRTITKGDVFGVARIAGIMAAKKTSDFIPLCHQLDLTSVELAFTSDRKTSSVVITATVTNKGRTGVEMEALTAVAAAGLTIYDMCKAVDKTMTLTDVRLLKKTGGRSGTFSRNGKP